MKNQFAGGEFQARLLKASGPECRAEELQLRNSIYRTWNEIWTGVFAEVGQADAVTPDEFFRQHAILCITTARQELVGLHLCTFFDLKSDVDRQHSYFDSFNELSFMRLKKEGIRRVMSVEYLTVVPEFRRVRSGVAWGEVLIALGQRIMAEAGYDAVIGTTRVDIGVDRMCDRLGFEVIQTGIKKYDYTCSLTFCTPQHIISHPNESTDRLINNLWVNRIDTANIGALQAGKKAA